MDFYWTIPTNKSASSWPMAPRLQSSLWTSPRVSDIFYPLSDFLPPSHQLRSIFLSLLWKSITKAWICHHHVYFIFAGEEWCVCSTFSVTNVNFGLFWLNHLLPHICYVSWLVRDGKWTSYNFPSAITFLLPPFCKGQIYGGHKYLCFGSLELQAQSTNLNLL